MMRTMHRLASFRARLRSGLSNLDSEESGQGMVEYAFILVLIALIVIVIVIVIGNQTRNMWSDISAQFNK